MYAWQNPPVTGQPFENISPKTPDRTLSHERTRSADDGPRQTSAVEQPKEVDGDRPPSMFGRGRDLNEPVVPIAELRLLAKTRERNSRTSKRARLYLFLAALLVVGTGVAGGRYLYPEVEAGVQSVVEVLPEQPLSRSPAPQAAKFEQPKTEVLSHQPAEPPPSATTADNPAELSDQRLETIVRDLAAVQSSVQQLAAKQEEITRSIAELQKGKHVKPTLLPPPARRAAARTANSPSNALPLQPANPAVDADVQPSSTSTMSGDSRTQVLRPPLPIRGD